MEDCGKGGRDEGEKLDFSGMTALFVESGIQPRRLQVQQKLLDPLAFWLLLCIIINIIIIIIFFFLSFFLSFSATETKICSAIVVCGVSQEIQLCRQEVPKSLEKILRILHQISISKRILGAAQVFLALRLLIARTMDWYKKTQKQNTLSMKLLKP
jgi:hypothetical protein